MSVSICKHEKFYSAVIDGVGTHHDTFEKAQEYLRNKVKILAYAVDSAIDTANDYEYNLKLQADKTAKTQEVESE